ncbi:hypothetical protein CSV79_14310 [Sporosarcina sp. P13]|uniref:GLUG motif-containing protein n=1 Tax=Sporosarcina sp. P13 TaxID=2048263 RepID=UPI000C1667FB|nr:GLUG motif-containing protein [Sporosarcina sp. P13]PIC62993.1 hypothetical protein CSV79_14310 [Sporosarcina sp. P13]
MNKDQNNISSIGGLVGKLNGGKIVNCSVEGTININGSATNVGSLVGSMDGGEIENSTANMKITILEDSVFSELKIVLEQINKVSERQDLIRLVDDMENSVGKPSFKEKYIAFVSNASAHSTLLSPFFSKLIEYIS